MKNDNRQLKEAIKQFKDELCKELHEFGNISHITRKLVNYIDDLLISLFHSRQLSKDNEICLIALGSYGRRELQLYSDVDILLLHTEQIKPENLQRAQQFIQDCWDAGLDISHQITTVKACADLAAQDVAVISTVMDMHMVCGRGHLMEELLYQTHPLHMWPSDAFFYAKQKEQNDRYAKYGETAYNLEPNVKNGPGGLRDLQILLSISKRHYHIKKLADGIYSGFITDKEYEELINCEHFLWKVRFALHLLADKREDRLIFDYQVKLAAFFGYKDNSQSLAIEQFMKAYFKIIKRNRELNEMLLQWFSEAIIHHQKQRLYPLDDEFQLSNHYIEVRHPKVFHKRPQAILTLFLWVAKRPDIQGVRANTIRLIRHSLFLIDKQFRASKTATKIFMDILKTDHSPYEALQRMNRYGVLARYLDPFSAVTGQMQYDLFHAYTVDQHTMFVIRNMARFNDQSYEALFPLCFEVFKTLKKPEILYLSGLFHDIAKGRGGDHSELGAIEAENFAKRHFIKKQDRDMLVWLVRHHLLMSITAQRKDIYDPQTISQFCQQLPHPSYLDYLYLLTVADICGTNPNLWNAWKDSLLKELYRAASEAMKKEKALLDENTLIQNRKEEALKLLNKSGFKSDQILEIWSNFKGKYFLHESPESIARHTKAILKTKTFPLILIMPHHTQGGTEVFIYMPHKDERFIVTTTVLHNNNVTIQEASITICKNGYDLDTYVILDEKNQALLDKQHQSNLKQALFNALSSAPEKMPLLTRRRMSRTQAHFKMPPKISFSEESIKKHTSLFLITSDRPGLLATISRVFFNLKIALHNAKIATAGERVEDMFYITNAQGQMLNADEKEQLKKALIKELYP